MKFCPKCGSWLHPNSIICPKCGAEVDGKARLDFLKSLIFLEKEEEKRKILKDRVSAEVVDVSEDAVTLECSPPKFEEGDVLGYVTPMGIKPLGVVISGGRIVTVSLRKPIEVEDGQKLELCEAEILVGYDLQLELIENTDISILMN